MISRWLALSCGTSSGWVGWFLGLFGWFWCQNRLEMFFSQWCPFPQISCCNHICRSENRPIPLVSTVKLAVSVVFPLKNWKLCNVCVTRHTLVTCTCYALISWHIVGEIIPLGPPPPSPVLCLHCLLFFYLSVSYSELDFISPIIYLWSTSWEFPYTLNQFSLHHLPKLIFNTLIQSETKIPKSNGAEL